MNSILKKTLRILKLGYKKVRTDPNAAQIDGLRIVRDVADAICKLNSGVMAEGSINYWKVFVEYLSECYADEIYACHSSSKSSEGGHYRLVRAISADIYYMLLMKISQPEELFIDADRKIKEYEIEKKFSALRPDGE